MGFSSTSVGGCDGTQAQLRGATPLPRSGAEAGRTPGQRGGSQEELPHVRGEGCQPRVTGCNSTGAAERSYPTLKVRKGGDEEITLVQSKEQWLRFAGAAVKRYPMPKVRETQVRR